MASGQDIPNVDFVGSETAVSMPVMPPLPPPPPTPRGEQAQVTVKYNTHAPNLPGMRQQPAHAPGVSKKDMSSVEFLAQIVNDPEAAAYVLEVYRTGPAMWNGEQLPNGMIERVPQVMTYPEISKRVTELHGGGDYRVRVIDDAGRCLKQLNFTVDTMLNPPMFSAARGVPAVHQVQIQRPSSPFGSPFGVPGMAPRPQALNAAAGEDDEVVRIRNEERKLGAKMSLANAEREQKRKEREAKREEEIEAERDAKRAGAPAHEVTTQIARMQSDSDKRFENIMAMMAAQQQRAQEAAAAQQAQTMNMMLALLSKPKDDNTAMLMVESMKSQTAQMTQMMTVMMASAQSKQQEMTLATQSQIENNKQIMDMAIKASSNGSQRFEKIFEQMLVKSMDSKNNDIKSTLEFIEMGRRQTLEIMELRGKDDDDDDLNYDAKAGVMGNLAKMIFGVLKGVLKGGGAGLGELLTMVGRPNAQSVTGDDLATLAQRLEGGQPQAQLPAPVRRGPAPGVPAFGAPPQLRVANPQRSAPSVPRPPPVRPEPTVAPLEAVSPIEGVYEDEEEQIELEVQPVFAAPQAAEVVPVSGNVHVNEAIRIAIEDVTAGRRSHEWVEYAFEKWERSLLDGIVAAKSHGARIDLIKPHCDIALFDQFLMLLSDEHHVERYTAFIMALNGLVVEHAQETGALVSPI